MKKILLATGLSIVYTFAVAQWTTLSSGTSNHLASVFFTSPETGYVTGNSGTLLKTINGGADWVPLTSGTSEDLNTVYFIDGNTGFAAGDQGILLKTTDGGSTWFPLSSGTTKRLFSLCFTTPDKGYVVGGDGFSSACILKTVDGGLNWTTTALASSTVFMAICFADEMTGYAAGINVTAMRGGVIAKTTDGGETWNIIQPSGNWYGLYSIDCTDANTAFAAGMFGTLIKTTNGGADWVSTFTGSSANLDGVKFADNLTGYAVGTLGLILKTVDGGGYWGPLTSGTTNELFSIHLLNPDTAYTSGIYGTILKTTNGGGFFVGVPDRLPVSYDLSVYPLPATDQVTIETGETAGNSLIEINNLGGQLLIRYRHTGSRSILDVSSLPAGYYLIRVVSDSGVKTGRLVKR